MTDFPARRTLRGAVFLVVALAAVAVFGLVLLAENEPLGWSVTVFGAILAGLVVLQTLRPWWRYGVGREGIAVHRLFGAPLIPRAQITTIEQVDGGRIEELLSLPQWASVNAGRAMSIMDGIRARRELGRIVTYVTVPVVLSQTVQKAPLAVRKVAARAHGQFALVTLSDGSCRALSPRDVPSFVAACRTARLGT